VLLYSSFYLQLFSREGGEVRCVGNLATLDCSVINGHAVLPLVQLWGCTV